MALLAASAAAAACAAIVGGDGAAATAGHALGEAHRRKLDKSWEACHRQGIEFLPLAVECLGAWHPSAIAELKKLVKGNAALFNNRSPPEPVTMGDEFTW